MSKTIGTQPLSEIESEIMRIVRGRRRLQEVLIIGVAGPPGAGKSTLALRFARSWDIGPSVCVSLDDFYLTPPTRIARGYKWRAPPGTHDLQLLDRFIDSVANGSESIQVPIYDRQHECRLEPAQVQGPLDLCVFEGWFVGAMAPGYERLARSLRLLVYLDMDEEEALKSRLERERSERSRGRPSLTDEQVAEFWRDALSPGLHQWVLPLRDQADMVVTIGRNHRLERLDVRQ